MSVIVAVSAHGSPGVTTCMEILAAVAPTETLLVEASGGGGSLAPRHTLPLDPGMSGLSEALRRREHPDILDYSQRLPTGVPFVGLSPSVSAAQAQLKASSAELGSFLKSVQAEVLVDAGVMLPGMPSEPLLKDADQVLWFVRPLREEVAHLAARLKELPSHAAQVVTVGTNPYSSDEIAAVVGIPATSIVFDEKGAAAFRYGGQDRKLQRSRLARSIRSLSDVLFASRPTSDAEAATA